MEEIRNEIAEHVAEKVVEIENKDLHVNAKDAGILGGAVIIAGFAIVGAIHVAKEAYTAVKVKKENAPKKEKKSLKAIFKKKTAEVKEAIDAEFEAKNEA